MNDTVFTPQQLAERWQCSVFTIRSLIHDGKINAFRIGHTLRVTADEVRRVETNSAPNTNIL